MESGWRRARVDAGLVDGVRPSSDDGLGRVPRFSRSTELALRDRGGISVFGAEDDEEDAQDEDEADDEQGVAECGEQADGVGEIRPARVAEQ